LESSSDSENVTRIVELSKRPQWAFHMLHNIMIGYRASRTGTKIAR
jgi:hypothetical protein